MYLLIGIVCNDLGVGPGAPIGAGARATASGRAASPEGTAKSGLFKSSR